MIEDFLNRIEQHNIAVMNNEELSPSIHGDAKKSLEMIRLARLGAAIEKAGLVLAGTTPTPSKEEPCPCPDCDGCGIVDCATCDAEGRIECDKCDGMGSVECYTCGGEEEIHCPTCSV